jgi:hypothetical protein
VSVAGAKTGRHLVADEAQLLQLRLRVQALTARAALRHHDVVPLLPDAQRRGGDAEYSRESADAVDGLISHLWIPGLVCAIHGRPVVWRRSPRGRRVMSFVRDR